MSAADVWIIHKVVGLAAIGMNHHLALETEHGLSDLRGDGHLLASIGALDVWHGAGLTQVGGPAELGRAAADQAAFFIVFAAKVIPVKIAAFFSKWSFHDLKAAFVE